MRNSLSNPDIAPVPASRRTWGTLHFFSLWVGMVVCIPTYMIAASLIDGGMNWSQAMWTVLLGNCIVLVPMLLNGHAGVKYGIPFPVLARASFGVRGSNIAAMLRALVACGWFGIQCWIGGAAIYSMLLVIWPGAAAVPKFLPAVLDVGLIPFACFLAFWAVNMWLIWRGVETIKILETWCAPFLLACGFALLVWAYRAADGFGPIVSAPSKFADAAAFWRFFAPALTGMVGFWATLSLNIADFTRYAKSQRAQVWGQALGLPTTMTLFAFIGIAVTGATVVVFGEAIWDPVVLVRRFDHPFLVLASMFAVLIATLATNLAANVVGPANDFSNLAPATINFRRGGCITGVIGILMMPWKLVADPSGYIFTWLIGYSALLGP
ncbi:MAG: NCS1 family nucleobase:cation symporter-1, partial [Deltaproteobacteria bacterium]|nr:NCS1 family nucleobase:cation symporter-1 [Deltaproteobacteria bacterium]